MKKIYYKNIPTNRKTKLVADLIEQYEELNRVLNSLRDLSKRDPKNQTYNEIYSRKLSEWSLLYRLLNDNGIAVREYQAD